MNLGDEYEGKLFDICAKIWEKVEKQASVRYNAFKLMIKIIKKTSGFIERDYIYDRISLYRFFV